MDSRQEDMEKLLVKEQQVVQKLRENREDAFRCCGALLKELVSFYQEFICVAEKHTIDIEIPVQILLQQLQNLEISYRQRDIVVLADTFEYEVKESICFYIDILKEYGEDKDV